MLYFSILDLVIFAVGLLVLIVWMAMYIKGKQY